MTGAPAQGEELYRATCLDIANALRRQATWVPIGIFCGGALFLFRGKEPSTLPETVILVAAALAACGCIALSTLLFFDARLFRMMATYPDEQAGGAAVDAYLAARRLKPRPAVVRPLLQRIAGAQRWAKRQRLLFIVFVALLALALTLD